MKLIYISSFFCAFVLNAQIKKYEGQAPIKIVPTISLPIQKQWKGDFKFKDSDIVFSNNFEGARLNGILKENDSTFVVLITPENTPINPSPWYAFKVWSKTLKTIDVILTYQSPVKHRYFPKLSKDGRHWKAIDSLNYKEFEKGDEDFGVGSLPTKVKLQVEIDSKPLWISGQELQTSKHVRQWVDSLAANKHTTKSIIGSSTEGRDMLALTIGKEKSKNMVMVISRQHPPEVTGYLAMKSFVETIAGDSKLAKKFRRKFAVYVVPLMNPDGVDNGHWRHSSGGIDLNRDWSNFNQLETQAVRDFMNRRKETTKGTFYFGIDFHSTWDDIYYTVDPELKGNMPGLVPLWLDKIKSKFPNYEPNVKPSSNMKPTAVSRNYFFIEYGAESLVYEVGDNTPRPLLKEKGSTSAKVLMQLLLDKI